MAEGELLHRLKLLSNKLQELMQDSELAVSNMYTPLSLYLVDDFFLNHNSKDVQLLVACCIADLIRIYAPEAPYKDQDQISVILVIIFFILFYTIPFPILGNFHVHDQSINRPH